MQKVGLLIRRPRQSIRTFVNNRRPEIYVSAWGSRAFCGDEELLKFQRSFKKNLQNCTWKPHPKYSVFTQYDQSFYLSRKSAFLHKYKCFYAVSKTIAPRRILELGAHAGSSADAYVSASPDAEYFGLDQFDDGVLSGIVHEVNGVPWLPQKIAEQLFEARGFKKYQLVKVDLRSLDKLPFLADFVVVDAAHDFDNEYADLKLALTAKPTFIFVDDSDGGGSHDALQKFLAEDVKDKVEYYCGISYIGGGLVIKLRPDA